MSYDSRTEPTNRSTSEHSFRVKFSLRHRILGTLAYLVVKILSVSLRWKFDNKKLQEPAILALWHGRQFLMIGGYSHGSLAIFKRPINALISEHGDGRIAAYAVDKIGLRSTAGSSTHGGRRALLQLLKLLRDKSENIAITPDGPRGPHHEVKPGILALAQHSGVPIYPVACSANKFWQLKSWDKMMIPKPFSQAMIMIAEPIFIPKKIPAEEFERLRLQIQDSLRKITDTADNYFKSKK